MISRRNRPVYGRETLPAAEMQPNGWLKLTTQSARGLFCMRDRSGQLADDPVHEPGNQVGRQAHGHRRQRDHETPEHEIEHRSPPPILP